MVRAEFKLPEPEIGSYFIEGIVMNTSHSPCLLFFFIIKKTHTRQQHTQTVVFVAPRDRVIVLKTESSCVGRATQYGKGVCLLHDMRTVLTRYPDIRIYSASFHFAVNL